MAAAVKFKDMSSPVKLVITLLSFALFFMPSEAFFRHLCFNPVGYGRIDPIMSPGIASQHLHQLFGASNLGLDSTDADYLLESNCTSCSITVDKSAYWTPAMYFEHADGTFEMLNTSGGITAYYKTEKRVNFEDRNYTVFPKGFRMIAGDSRKRHWVGPWPVPAQSFWTANDTTQDALATKSLGFNCLDYGRSWEEATFAYPYLRDKAYIDQNCKSGVRAEILFPSCWDGVNLDSDDHRSHVAYPTLLQDGACPDTHPVFLPVLFYETIWYTPDFVNSDGRFVMSNGDPTGFGYHGDFLAAWQDGILEQIVADPTCTDHDLEHRVTDGIQEHCNVIKDAIQSRSDAAQCKIETPQALMHESFSGVLNALPGSMNVTGQQHAPGTDPRDGSPHYVADSDSDTSQSPTVSMVDPTTSPSATIAAVQPPQSSSAQQSSTSTKFITSTITPSPPAPTTFISIYTTSAYTFNGTYYEVDVVQQIVTTITTITPTVTAIVTRRHIHGGRHHDFA